MRPSKDYLDRVNKHSRRSAGKCLYNPIFYFGEEIAAEKKDSPPLVKSEDEEVDLTDIEWKNPKEKLDFNLEDSDFSVLPTDLCIEIFQRLSINDLKSCCGANRSLNNSLTNPEFAFLHHNYQVNHSTSSALFLSLDTIDFFTTELEDHNTRLSVKPLKFINFDKCFSGANHQSVCDVVGSVNGLICFTGDHLVKGSSSHYLISNPITKEYVVLPKSKRHNVTAGGSAFGYSPTSKEYKVIRVIQSTYVSCLASGQFEATAEIFTLGNDQWRDIWKCPYITDFTSQAQVNGCLHWLSYIKDDLCKGNYLKLNHEEEEQAPRRVIVAFDVGFESYKFIEPPQYSTRKNDINKSILVLEDKLCFLDSDIDGTNEIWSLELYGNQESWRKKYSINNLPNHYKMSYVYEFPDHVIVAQSSVNQLQYFDPYLDSWQSIQIEGLPHYHVVRPIVFSPTLFSPRNVHHIQTQRVQSDGVRALSRELFLSDDEIKVLKEGDLDEVFFKALSRANCIRVEGSIAFTKKNERAGLLKLDSIEDNAYKRLRRWLADEIFKLDDEHPEVGDLLKRAAGFLKKKPNLFMSLLTQVVNTRYHSLFKRFDKVLNEDDGVPQEYVLHLLVWLHQALVVERGLVLELLHPAAMDTRPVARRCLQLDSAMGEPKVVALVDKICEGVSRSFHAKVNRIFWQSQIDHKVAYELCDLLGFYSAIICDSLGGKIALCYTLDTLKDEADKTFLDIIKTTVDKLLEPPLSNVSVDVSPPQAVMQGVAIVVEIIRASEVRLDPSKCDLELVISTVLDPVVQLCELAAEERDAKIFLVNSLAFIQEKLVGCAFTQKYVGRLKIKIAENINSLVEIELKAILQGCGFPYSLSVLKSSVNNNDVQGVTIQFQLTDTECAPPASLSECLSTFPGLVLPTFEQMQDSQLRLQTSICLARSLAEAYTMVYDASSNANTLENEDPSTYTK